MSAKNLLRVSKGGTYSHVYNRGVDGKVIFGDKQDYDVFLSYLKEYLSAPPAPESVKKEFTVNGHTYSGTPHQPQNYFTKVELIGYSLSPDQFQLILHQIVDSSQSNFLKSLCTRYSMYFNKRYNRQGTLFDGPYKSIEIADLSKLPYLSYQIHTHNENGKDFANEYSSYAEYLGKRETSWVNPAVVLEKTGNYLDFIGNYKPDPGEKKLVEEKVEALPVEQKIPPIIEQARPTTKSNLPAFITAATAIFVALFAIGLRNVVSAPNPAVAGAAIQTEVAVEQTALPTAIPSPTPTVLAEAEPTPQTVMVIKVEGLGSVNLYQDPDVTSKIVTTTQKGDTFEVVSEQNGWYEIDLNDGYAFIASDSAQIITR